MSSVWKGEKSVRTIGMIRKHLSEPWFSLVYVGAKKFEGRLGNSDLRDAGKGALVTWYNDDTGQRRSVITEITSKTMYRSFSGMLRDKGVSNVLPTVKGVSHGVSIYERFYPRSKQKEHGVLCLGVRPVCD